MRKRVFAAHGLIMFVYLPVAFSGPQSFIEHERLVLMATKIAQQYQINQDHFFKTIQCESQWDPEAQSGYLSEDGTQENSWGIAQWNLDTNDMTKEQALDPHFALTKMAEAWQKGQAPAWGCYRLWEKRNWK
jgi:hypothetical protein